MIKKLKKKNNFNYKYIKINVFKLTLSKYIEKILISRLKNPPKELRF